MTHPARCPYERFPDRAAADLAAIERRARADLAGAPREHRLTSYDCDRCAGAHLIRATTPEGAAS